MGGNRGSAQRRIRWEKKIVAHSTAGVGQARELVNLMTWGRGRMTREMRRKTKVREERQ